MEYQWGSVPGGNRKERRGKRAELPEEVAKKLKSCSVLNCEEWRDLNDTSTTYHCFPTGDKNQQRWELWTGLLQQCRDDKSWIPFRGSLVCSHHFQPTDFVQDPNQKRRKLVKNAIPSIFPTFTANLNDPSFAIDDSNDAPGEMDNGENENDQNDGYYYNEEEDNEYGYEQDPTIPDVNIDEYPDEEDMEEEELTFAAFSQPQPQRRITQQQQPTIPSKPALPKLTPVNSFVRRSNDYESAMEPPKKKMVSNGNAIAAQQSSSKSYSVNGGVSKPPLTFKGNSFNNRVELRLGSNSTTSNGRSPVSNNSRTTFQNSNHSNSPSSTSKLYQQLCKTVPNTKFPMSWNSDLEIELVNSQSGNSSTISMLSQRVDELETENEALKQKYSSQIRALQRRIKEQDKIINEYVAHFNSIGDEEDDAY